MPPQEPGRSNGLIDATADWLMTRALGATPAWSVWSRAAARAFGAPAYLCTES